MVIIWAKKNFQKFYYLIRKPTDDPERYFHPFLGLKILSTRKHLFKFKFQGNIELESPQSWNSVESTERGVSDLSSEVWMASGGVQGGAQKAAGARGRAGEGEGGR